MFANRAVPLTMTVALHVGLAGLMLARPWGPDAPGASAYRGLATFALPMPEAETAPKPVPEAPRPAARHRKSVAAPGAEAAARTRLPLAPATAPLPALSVPGMGPVPTPPLPPLPAAGPPATAAPGTGVRTGPARALGLVAAAATPAVGAFPAPSAGTGADSYDRRVHRWIEGRKSYPAHLAARRLAGTVLVRFELDRGGRLCGHIAVVRSSGERALDQLAQQQLAAAAPFPRPPANSDWHRRSFTIPLTYKPQA